MKKIVLSAVAAAALLAAAVTTQASTIQVVLGVSPTTGSAATATNAITVTPGTAVKVYVFGKADTLQSTVTSDFNAATTQTEAGGIRGLQFDVKNASGNNSVNYNGGTATAVFPSSIRSNFSTIAPTKTADGAGGNYALGGSIFDAAGFGYTTMGTPDSTTAVTSGAFKGYDLLATETWTVGASPMGTNNMSVNVVGPTYYDTNNANNNYQSDFGTVQTAGATIAVPEPASLGLLGLGLLGLAARRRQA